MCMHGVIMFPAEQKDCITTCCADVLFVVRLFVVLVFLFCFVCCCFCFRFFVSCVFDTNSYQMRTTYYQRERGFIQTK